MKTTLTILASMLSLFGLAQSDSIIIYPAAPHSDITDTFWQTEVKDKYRSLESNNTERSEWLAKEEEITKNYFKKIKHKTDIETDCESMMHANFNIPVHMSPYYIERIANPNRDVVDLYYKRRLYSETRLELLSPTSLNKDVKQFTNYAVSADGHYLAFSYSVTGSDWQEIGVYDIAKSKMLKDHISNLRYVNNILWSKNGFFYTRFDEMELSKRYLEVATNQSLYYHVVGSQSNDSLVYQANDAINIFEPQLINNRFLIIEERNRNTNTTLIKFKDISSNSPFYSINVKTGFSFDVIGADSSNLYVVTNYPDAYNKSIVKINVNDLSNWNVIVPNQTKFLIKDATYINNKFYVVYQHSFTQTIVIYSDSGDLIKQIVRSPGGETKLIGYSPEEKSIILSENYYFCPPLGSLLDVKLDSITYISKTEVNFDPFRYLFDIGTYTSADGTKIPIYMLRNKKYYNKGPRPLLLSFYGGFGITPSPSFDPGMLLFLNNGGIFAFANVRGGENSIKDWHKNGALLNKQNTFDDVFYAAKFLVDSGFADPEKLALEGGSNGGLVGAAVINQHPGYFKAAILHVGLYDMIRAENFTVGVYHSKGEYGSVNDKRQFQNLLSYSPLHNIRPNTQYPAILVETALNDDRVPPLHSYKYVASLQELTKSTNPILLRIEKNEGHSTQSRDRMINNVGYDYSFLFRELGMKYK